MSANGGGALILISLYLNQAAKLCQQKYTPSYLYWAPVATIHPKGSNLCFGTHPSTGTGLFLGHENEEQAKESYAWDLQQLRHFARQETVLVGEFSMAGPCLNQRLGPRREKTEEAHAREPRGLFFFCGRKVPFKTSEGVSSTIRKLNC